MEKETNVIHIEMEREYERADKKGLGSIVAFRLGRVNRRAYLNGELKYSDSLDGDIYLAKMKSEEDPIIRLAAFLQGRDTMTEKQIMRLTRKSFRKRMKELGEESRKCNVLIAASLAGACIALAILTILFL